MALIRWEPARELQSIQQEMNRLFGTFFDSPTTSGGNGGSYRRWIPAMDLVEQGDHYVLRADLPGLSEKDVKVEFEDSVLTISGERKSEHEDRKQGYYRIERSSGAFSRSLTLPEGIDPDGVQARFDNGVLEVRVPKPEERKPRRVAIGVSGSVPDTAERSALGGVRGTSRPAGRLLGGPPVVGGFRARPVAATQQGRGGDRDERRDEAIEAERFQRVGRRLAEEVRDQPHRRGPADTTGRVPEQERAPVHARGTGQP